MNSDDLKGEPRGYFLVVPAPSGPEDDIDLPGILRRLWRGRIWIVAAVLVGAALAALHAYTTQPTYRSSALLTVRSTEDSPLAMLRGQLGGLVSLAGLNIGASGGSQRAEYIAFLESRELAKEFVESQELMQILFANRWDPVTNKFRSNRSGRVPSIGDAVQKLGTIRDVSQDRAGLVTISFEWTDPDLAARWATEYTALANEKLRQEAIDSAELGLEYLNRQLERTSLEPLRQSLFRLMEGRLNEVMAASVEPDFPFKVIDRAEPAELHKFVRPMRMLEIFLGFVGGLSAGMILVLWRYRENS